MKNRLVVFVVFSALSMAVLSCAGGATAPAEEAPAAPVSAAPAAAPAATVSAFEGVWTEQSYGVTLTIAGTTATVKDGPVTLAEGTITIAADGNSAKVTSTAIANAANVLVPEVVSVDLTLTGGKITAAFEGTTYTFTK